MAPFCVICKKEYRCRYNGTILHFGGGHCYKGDYFCCAGCGHEIITGFSTSFHDPKLAKASPKLNNKPFIIQADRQIKYSSRWEDLE